LDNLFDVVGKPEIHEFDHQETETIARSVFGVAIILRNIIFCPSKAIFTAAVDEGVPCSLNNVTHFPPASS
jgi:hypothetical protein